MRYEEAKRFIKENARPLELAFYQFHFENAPKDLVVEELKKFQNEDGGFGHGLEADNWNPNSNPIATNDAMITLYRIGALEKNSDIVQGIIRYLSSHDSFDEVQKRWLFAIESNMEYPHAIWWEKGEKDGIDGFNPTVSLAAFLVCFGDNPAYYAEIVQEGFSFLEDAQKLGGDALKCYMLSYELLRQNGIFDVIDMDAAYSILCRKIEDEICKDTNQYGVEYVSTPSFLFTGIYQNFITDEIKELIDVEKQILENFQKEDGGFDITWKWYTDYKEFEVARTWWRAKITIEKLLFASL